MPHHAGLLADLGTSSPDLTFSGLDLGTLLTDLTKSVTDLVKSGSDLGTLLTDLTKSITDLTKSVTDLTKSVADLTKSVTNSTRKMAGSGNYCPCRAANQEFFSTQFTGKRSVPSIATHPPD